MASFRDSKGRRFAWLLSALLMLGAGGRSVCRCAGETDHCAGGSSEEPVASCHGQDAPGEDCAPATEHRRTDPCPPGHDCCCVDAGTPAAKAPESLALDHHSASASVAVAFAHALPLLQGVRAAVVRPRPPKEHSPPLFVVNCTFRC